LYDSSIVGYLNYNLGNGSEESYKLLENKIKDIPTLFELVKDGVRYYGYVTLRFEDR